MPHKLHVAKSGAPQESQFHMPDRVPGKSALLDSIHDRRASGIGAELPLMR